MFVPASKTLSHNALGLLLSLRHVGSQFLSILVNLFSPIITAQTLYFLMCVIGRSLQLGQYYWLNILALPCFSFFSTLPNVVLI
jgi:hypothetical protein